MSSPSLPVLTTPFIGRKDELAQIADLLAAPDCRLLTLVGPGGMGKTRLAVEAARQTRFPNSVCFVPLQPLASPDFLIPAIADALNFSFFGEQAPRAQLINHLGDKSLLLVLDNFEHLLGGVDLLPDILNAAPRVKLLVTTRERLRLQEEWVLDVAGLSYPSAGEDATSPEAYGAVELFVQRARQVQAGFSLDNQLEAVKTICQQVEGMPLGLELAASWLHGLSCSQIAKEITHSLDILTTTNRNVLEKHRSMRAVFEYSWQLLSEAEQAILTKLSVFRGGFTREAAEFTAGASLAALAALVDKSLLRVDENGRYDLHELLRQYGQERLNQAADDMFQAHDRHCIYYMHFLEAQWPRLTGSEIKSALSEINLELDNVRAAWEWAVNNRNAGLVEAALRSLWFFYGVSSYYQEGTRVFATAASAFSDNPVIYGKLLARWGELEILSGAFYKAHDLLHESLKLLREAEARSEIAFVLYRLTLLSRNSPEHALEETVYLEESLTLYTDLGDTFGMAESLGVLGNYYLRLYHKQGHPDHLQRAQHYFQQSLQVSQKRESVFGLAVIYDALSEVAEGYKDYPQALQYIQASLKIFQDLSIFWGLVPGLAGEGFFAYKLGDYTLARQCTLENLRLSLERGLDHNPYGKQFMAAHILTSLHLGAALLLDEGKRERAYELLATVNQQLLDLQIQPDRSRFFLLHLLDEELLPHLAAVVERGRERDFKIVVKELIQELTENAKSIVSSTSSIASDSVFASLTKREMEILRLLTDGLDSREVADRLYLSVGTIRWYIKQIYSKLDAHSRSQAIARARELQLLA